MSHFLFKLFHGVPMSPSMPPPGTPAGKTEADSDDELKNDSAASPKTPSTTETPSAGDGAAVASYAGVFDVGTGIWFHGVYEKAPNFKKLRSHPFSEVAVLISDLEKPPTPAVHRSSALLEAATAVGSSTATSQQQQHQLLSSASLPPGSAPAAFAGETVDPAAEDSATIATTSSTSATITIKVDKTQPQSPSSSQQAPSPNPVPADPTLPVRLTVISDTHQYHECVRLPYNPAYRSVLICCGDILMTDRWNLPFVSDSYVRGFFTWFNAQPHPVKIFIGGNHCHQIEVLHKAGTLKDMAKPAIFLTGDEVYEVFGLRFFGNSWSTGTGSSNQAFQDDETLGKLASPDVALAKVVKIDPALYGGATVVDGATQPSSSSAASGTTAAVTPTKDENNQQQEEVTSCVVSASPDDAAATSAVVTTTAEGTTRRPAHRRVDILVTHCNMPHKREIVQRLNPLLHLNGHYHGYHGVRRGPTRLREGKARFERRTPQLHAQREGQLLQHFYEQNNQVDDDGSGVKRYDDASLKSAMTDLFVVDEVPVINASIVKSLSGYTPKLHPPTVVDVIPFSEGKF